MDLEQTSTVNVRLATFTATILFGICLLNCGCQPAPAGSDAGDPNSNPPAASKDVAGSAKKTVEKAKPKSREPDVNDVRFHAAIKTAAEKYLDFAMVNTTGLEAAAARVAPVDCRPILPAGMLEDPAARMSQVESDSGHGRKLYFLFAKDIAHYVNSDGSESPVGQVLIKESWTAVPGNPDARNLRSHSSGNRVNPRVTVGGETLKLGKRKDLFVMLKQAPKTEGTDGGWVYGVVDPKSYEIKSSGAVASCIVCHEGEKDRLFRDGIIDWEAEAIKQAEAETEAAAEKKSNSPAAPETDE